MFLLTDIRMINSPVTEQSHVSFAQISKVPPEENGISWSETFDVKTSCSLHYAKKLETERHCISPTVCSVYNCTVA